MEPCSLSLTGFSPSHSQTRKPGGAHRLLCALVCLADQSLACDKPPVQEHVGGVSPSHTWGRARHTDGLALSCPPHLAVRGFHYATSPTASRTSAPVPACGAHRDGAPGRPASLSPTDPGLRGVLSGWVPSSSPMTPASLWGPFHHVLQAGHFLSCPGLSQASGMNSCLSPAALWQYLTRSVQGNYLVLSTCSRSLRAQVRQVSASPRWALPRRGYTGS